MSWIDINIQEPPLDTTVLVSWIGEDIEPEKDYMTHDVELGVNIFANHTDEDSPTHWMPLPEPPK